MGPSRGSESGLTREVAEQGGAIFFVPSGLFSPYIEVDALMMAAPESLPPNKITLSTKPEMPITRVRGPGEFSY